jgi:hypothetical protein
VHDLIGSIETPTTLAQVAKQCQTLVKMGIFKEVRDVEDVEDASSSYLDSSSDDGSEDGDELNTVAYQGCNGPTRTANRRSINGHRRGSNPDGLMIPMSASAGSSKPRVRAATWDPRSPSRSSASAISKDERASHRQSRDAPAAQRHLRFASGESSSTPKASGRERLLSSSSTNGDKSASMDDEEGTPVLVSRDRRRAPTMPAGGVKGLYSKIPENRCTEMADWKFRFVSCLLRDIALTMVLEVQRERMRCHRRASQSRRASHMQSNKRATPNWTPSTVGPQLGSRRASHQSQSSSAHTSNSLKKFSVFHYSGRKGS